MAQKRAASQDPPIRIEGLGETTAGRLCRIGTRVRITTAEHEAWRLNRAETDHASLSIEETERVGPALWDVAEDRDHAAIRLRLREALAAFARLREQPREIKALQITGYTYDEIAAMRGLTYTRVNHLLVEAHAALREDQGRSAAGRIDGPSRAVRLNELEQDPPRWLRRAIGRRPPPTTERQRSWHGDVPPWRSTTS